MCGIAAVYQYDLNSEVCDARQEMLMMREHMLSRGPDDAGSWTSEDKRVVLGHRRLSIQDTSSNGRQPMVSLKGRYVISFNGEIYNFKEIKADLIRNGYVFKSDSDTEILINLYDLKKENMFEELRGMYALVIWDNAEKKMILARDPYGIKPLYYSVSNHTVYIASQVKAILKVSSISHKKSQEAGLYFLMTGSIPEPHTSYSNIHQVPSGHYVVADMRGVQNPVAFADLSSILSDENQQSYRFSEQETQQYIREKLMETVRYHFVSDVPVGIFLSSGIDSACLVALARDCGVRNITTITLGFDEFSGTMHDERPLAARIAERYQTTHIERVLTKEQFLDELPGAITSMDQPSIDGLNTYFVSQAAASHGLKVALSGVGADELFGGYPSFRRIPQISQINRMFKYVPGRRELWKCGVRLVSKHIKPLRSKWEDLMSVGTEYSEIYGLIRGLFSEEEMIRFIGSSDSDGIFKKLKTIHRTYGSGCADGCKKIIALESGHYMRNQLLRDADWAGMAHSVEIRTPFVDYHLLKELTPYLTENSVRNGKKYLVNSPDPQLPSFITGRKKSGFTIPMERWMEDNLIGNPVSLKHNYKNHWSQQWAIKIFEEFFA